MPGAGKPGPAVASALLHGAAFLLLIALPPAAPRLSMAPVTETTLTLQFVAPAPATPPAPIMAPPAPSAETEPPAPPAIDAAPPVPAAPADTPPPEPAPSEKPDAAPSAPGAAAAQVPAAEIPLPPPEVAAGPQLPAHAPHVASKPGRAPAMPDRTLRAARSRPPASPAPASPLSTPGETRLPEAPAPQPAASAAPVAAAISPAWENDLDAWLQRHKVYPERARQRGQEGAVVIRFSLARDGQVQDVSVLRGSGSEILDAAAAALLRDARVPGFPPGMPQAEARVTVTVRYALEQ